MISAQGTDYGSANRRGASWRSAVEGRQTRYIECGVRATGSVIAEVASGRLQVSYLSSPLSQSMAMVASTLDGPIVVDELLRLICLAAIDNVRGVEYAGITLADRHGRLETPAATHALVHRVDALQYKFKQGPCVDAVQGRWQARSDDLSVDVRWPEYGPLAADLGIVSQMGIELFDEPGLIAGLNLYSSTAGAFDDDTVEAAMLFAIQATHTLGRVMTQKQLTDAMTTSTIIGRATGVVMQRFQLSADRAFELLTRVSRIRDVTIDVLADQILAEVTHPPLPIAVDASAGSLSLLAQAG